MIPLKGAIEYKIYKFEGGETKIDDITDFFLKMDEIASTQYGWIKNEKDFVKKSKLFYNFITNFERNGYSIFYDAMQKFKTGRRYCTEFGKFFII